LSTSDHDLSVIRPLLPEERRQRIARLVEANGSVKVAALEEEFGISPMTARRDLVALERAGRVQRTHGGAVLPGFAAHEDSFQRRMAEEIPAKRRLARVAAGLAEPGETIFIDSSTTAYHAAKTILDEGLRVTLLTNSVPVMELFTDSRAPNVELVGMGGSLRRLTHSFVGPHTVRTVGAHFADRAFFSVKGLTESGYLSDPDPLEAEVKRAMIEQSREPVLLVDGTKFEQRGLSVITHVREVALVLAADAPEDRLVALAEAGVEVRRV
jgi:DeoR/GlpR family transcriptional regulator of sugar metabolism